MARIRSIHPRALESKKLRRASAEAERVYWRLQPLCDDEGRCEDDVDLLAHMLFPGFRDLSPAQVDLWIWELADLGLVARYVREGRETIQIVKWNEFQHPQHPKPSTLPPYLPGTELKRPADLLIHEEDRKPHEEERTPHEGSGQERRGEGATHASLGVNEPCGQLSGVNSGDRDSLEEVRAQRLRVVGEAKRRKGAEG